jgi:hypothetical protein
MSSFISIQFIPLEHFPDRNSRPDQAPKTFQWDAWNRLKYKLSKKVPSKTKKSNEARQFSQSPVNVPYPYHWLHFGSNKTLRKFYNYRALCFYVGEFYIINSFNCVSQIAQWVVAGIIGLWFESSRLHFILHWLLFSKENILSWFIVILSRKLKSNS